MARYIDAANFEGHFNHQKWLDKVREDVKISKEVFVHHFLEKYSDHKDLPLWMMPEVISFRSHFKTSRNDLNSLSRGRKEGFEMTSNRLSIFFRFIKKEYRNGLAKEFYGLPSQVLASWLQSLTYIRNVCAHHSRLWNRDLPVSPKIPKGTKQWQSYSKEIFNVIMVFKNMIPGGSLVQVCRGSG